MGVGSRASRSASSPVPSGEESSTTSTVWSGPVSSSSAAHGLHERREVLALVVGRHDDPDGPGDDPRASPQYLTFTRPDEERRDRRRAGRARRPLRARRRGRLPGGRLPAGGARGPRLAALRGPARGREPGDRDAAHRQDARGEDQGARRDRRDPGGRQAAREVPRRAGPLQSRSPASGPKTARKIYDELGIATLDELRAAAESGALKSIQGLGPKAEQNILESLDADERARARARLLLSAVLAIGDQIVEELREHPAADRVEIAGSARRMTDTCKDLDIIATADDPAALTKAFTALELVARGALERRGGRADRHPQRPARSTSASSRRTSSATCSST